MLTDRSYSDCFLFGVGLSVEIARFMGWPCYIDFRAATIAFLFYTVMGMFSRYYPVHEAAFLDPIEALRYE